MGHWPMRGPHAIKSSEAQAVGTRYFPPLAGGAAGTDPGVMTQDLSEMMLLVRVSALDAGATLDIRAETQWEGEGNANANWHPLFDYVQMTATGAQVVQPVRGMGDRVRFRAVVAVGNVTWEAQLVGRAEGRG